jgi:proteic killer suppression protein
MRLTGFRHRGLKRIYDGVSAKGMPVGAQDKLRKLLFAMETADNLDHMSRFPGWRLHPLKGSLHGLWSLTVTGNWRLVFRYEKETNTASNIDLIDYH